MGHNHWSRDLSFFLLLLFCFLGCTGCGGESRDREAETFVDREHVLYGHFLAVYGDKEPLLTGANDINTDGLEDLIVIYREAADSNKMIAIWQESGEVNMSEPTPAPLENCRIEWRDIDDKDPVELILSGSKGVNVGYAIYRWQEGIFFSLFGDGMDDCC